VQPLPMGTVLDRWLADSLALRVKQGLLKPSTEKSYRSMLATHLRPAFGEYRSDMLRHGDVNAWAKRMAAEIAEGNLAPKFYNNVLDLLHAILAWARHKITTPKTESSIRVVDTPQRTLDELMVYREMFPPKPVAFSFRTEKGTPIDPDNWYKRRFLSLLEWAGLRQVRLHALRHTYASLLINQGESIKYVSRQLGHASIQITADLYGHLFRETSVSAMRRLELSMIGGGVHLTLI
jgi:Phage integrase family